MYSFVHLQNTEKKRRGLNLNNHLQIVYISGNIYITLVILYIYKEKYNIKQIWLFKKFEKLMTPKIKTYISNITNNINTIHLT